MKNEEILDSWKAISEYLDRDIRTCYRWEKELGLPIRRIDNTSSHSKIFAYKSEIDQWLKEKACNKEIEKKSFWENRRVIIGLVFGSVLISIIFAFLYFTHRQPSQPLSKNLSIAVLPFENLNASEYDEYFSEGITTEIINNLTIMNKLKVIPAASVCRYKNTTKNANEIGKELGVGYILKGKINKTDNKINLAVQLSRIKDDTNIWRIEFDEPLENIFYVQENICQKIAEILNINITESIFPIMKRGKTDEYVAFDNYLKGNYILNRLNGENSDPWNLYHQGKYLSGKCTKESNELAINLFEKAIKIDSNFALAYIGLAQCYTNYVNFVWDYSKKWLDKAEDLSKISRNIYTDFPEYYSTLIEIFILKEVCFNEDTIKIAYKLAQEGIKKYPNHPQLNSIVGYCYYLKFGEEGNEADFNKALDYKEKGFWLNPYGFNNIVFAEFLMLNKEFQKSLNICYQIKQYDSSLMINFRLGEIYYYMGDLDKSLAVFQQFESPLIYKISSLFYQGMIAAQRGEKEKSLTIIDKINLMSPKEFDFRNDYLKLASIYMGLGMKELGYKYLISFFNKPIAKKSRFIHIKYIDIDRNFNIFKEEEKFKNIIKQGGNSWQEANQSE